MGLDKKGDMHMVDRGSDGKVEMAEKGRAWDAALVVRLHLP